MKFYLIENFGEGEVKVGPEAPQNTKYPFYMMKTPGDILEVTEATDDEIKKCRNQVHSFGYDRKIKFGTKVLPGKLVIWRKT